ncbi:MAG TPA: acetamidase/formamidase family protein, partial [Ktedonobacterales bacterium]|nr:acetamidase/formamidase family protein [Ktedonobacterales bacterium]
GPHSTVPPRPTGGNIDCRELISGSTLWLPVAVEGALFSTGDGHAVQGDGEVAGPAIEIPMERVELTLTVRHDLSYVLPQAETPAGYLTFGFGDTLDAAMRDALAGMVAHLSNEYHLSRPQAVALASCVVSLRVTQIVNGTLGVHALLPPNSFQQG